MSKATDAELLVRAGSGDQQAWRELVERYSSLLWAVVRAQGLDRERAADVIQTVWLNLMRNTDRIRQPEALRGWLATVARHEAMRADRRQRRTELVDDVESSAPVIADDPDQRLIVDEQRVILRRCLQRLDERCRELLRLLYSNDEISYADIAATIERPIGSIGPTRARCLEHLRRLVAGEGG